MQNQIRLKEKLASDVETKISEKIEAAKKDAADFISEMAFVLPVNTDCCGKYLKDKYDFLYETLPFINPSHFIFTSNKKVFSADIRIDDRLNNLGNAKLNILFPSYHNKNIKEKDLEGLNIIRAGKSIEDAWLEIEKTLL